MAAEPAAVVAAPGWRARLELGLAPARGRTICAQRVDGPYGTFTDRAIVVEDGMAYIVTSEIRIPPMVVAGVLSFGRGEGAAARSSASEFMDREARSRDFLREHVTVEE